MTTYTRHGVTVHLMEPVCLRFMRKLVRRINLPAPKTCWLC